MDKIQKILEKQKQFFTSYEKYCKELKKCQAIGLEKGKLKWDILHTDKFWDDNVSKF